MAKDKGIQQPQPQQTLTRVYMDIPAEVHHAAKIAALQANTTLKGWLESLIQQALKPAPKGKK